MALQFSEETEARFQTIVGRYPNTLAALLPVLHLAQSEFGWISVEVMDYVAERLDLPPSKVLSTATFYTMYDKAPLGKLHLQVCTTLSCALCGSYRLVEWLESRLDCRLGETTEDGNWTLTEVECLASCGTAPMFQVTDSKGNIEYFEDVHTEERLDEIVPGFPGEDR